MTGGGGGGNSLPAAGRGSRDWEWAGVWGGGTGGGWGMTKGGGHVGRASVLVCFGNHVLGERNICTRPVGSNCLHLRKCLSTSCVMHASGTNNKPHFPCKSVRNNPSTWAWKSCILHNSSQLPTQDTRDSLPKSLFLTLGIMGVRVLIRRTPDSPCEWSCFTTFMFSRNVFGGTKQFFLCSSNASLLGWCFVHFKFEA